MVKIFRLDDDNLLTCNSYVIGKINSSCILIDLGSTGDEIIDYIDSHYDKCLAVFLTHAHFDHIRGLNKFLKRYKDIPVYVSKDDYNMLFDPSLNASRLMGEQVKLNNYSSIITIEDNQEIKIKGFDLKVIATPFHTIGSVCYLIDSDNALFTGDTLFKGGIGRTDFPTGNPNQVLSSLAKIKKLKDTLVVYPGHGDITRLGEEKKTNPYLNAA